MRDEDPEGWVTASPLALADLVRGVSYKAGEAASAPASGRLPLLRANNIADDLMFKDLQYVPESRVSLAQRLRRGDVVLAMSSGSKAVVGKAASLGEPWAGTFGAFCGVLRPSAVLDADFFGLYFKTNHYRKAISAMSAGTSINNLKREYFDRLSVQVAPLAEQKRIVAKVEELVTPVKAARERLARVRTILKRFRRSVLAAACSGELIESVPVSEEWPETALRDLLIDARYGTSDRCRERIRGAVPVLRVPNIVSGKLDLTSLKFALPQRNWASLMLQDGDILICRTNGSLDLIGKAAVVADLSEPAAFASYLIRLRTNTRALLPRFLQLFLLSPSGRDQITAEARTTAGQFNLNLEILRGLRFMLPPVDAQAEIVRRVDVLFALAETIEHRVAAASARADALTQSVLARAFRGELVPTEAELARAEGRDYESAEALLARVRSERAATVPTTGGRRRVARRAGARP